MEKSRNKSEIDALGVIYSILTYQAIDVPIDLEDIISGICGESYEDVDLFIKESAIGTLRHLNEMSEEIELALNKWKWTRLNRVAQSIFLLSLAHYRYCSEPVDRNVILDVAVSLAKKFLDANDYRYINAVLEKVL